MAVSLVLHHVEVKVRIPLMCRSQLMVPDDLVAGYLLPFRRPDVMLRVDQWVADEANVRQDADEVRGWHRVPFVPVDFGVVDLSKMPLEICCVEDEPM